MKYTFSHCPADPDKQRHQIDMASSNNLSFVCAWSFSSESIASAYRHFQS